MRNRTRDAAPTGVFLRISSTTALPASSGASKRCLSLTGLWYLPRMPGEEDVQVKVPEGRIDLGVGQPDPNLLPLEEIRRAAAERLASADVRLLAYGAQQGGRGFRELLAAFLSSSYGAAVHAERLFITAGASHGLDLVCSRLTSPGDTVLVEEPTYFAALRILADRGLKLVPIPMDSHGLVVDALPELCERHRPKFLYTIPVFHNPSGVTLTSRRREQLVELANRFDFHVVADEVYQLLGYGRRPPPPMCTFDDSRHRVISVCAFTKILAPGLRLGWIEGPPEFCEGLAGIGVHFSGGGVSPFTSAVVRASIELGLQEQYLAKLRMKFAERASRLYWTLKRELPESVEFAEPRGGYFIWMRFTDGRKSEALLPEAHRRGVGFRAGPLFSCERELEDWLRVGFTYYDGPTLEEGARRLGDAIAGR